MTSFTYITVVLNNRKTISRCIESILSEKKVAEIQYIVIDGGSTDGTFEVIESYGKQIDIITRGKDSGIYDAMNKGLERSVNDYICFVNGDDWLQPGATMELNRILSMQSTKPDVLATAAIAHAQEWKLQWSPARVDKLSAFRCPNLCHNSLYASRSAYAKVGQYNTKYRIAADSEWVLRAHAAGCSFQYSTKPTVHFSLGGTSSNLYLHAQEMREIASSCFPRLNQSIIDHLLYHFFAWPERRTLILRRPYVPLRSVCISAIFKYPSLFFIILLPTVRYYFKSLVRRLS